MSLFKIDSHQMQKNKNASDCSKLFVSKVDHERNLECPLTLYQTTKFWTQPI